MAQTVTIGEQKVSPESESLKFSATPTPQVENPSDSNSTALVETPLEFNMLLLTVRRRSIVFAYFLLVNLSTYCKYYGMNLYTNFKEHCKWDKK